MTFLHALVSVLAIGYNTLSVSAESDDVHFIQKGVRHAKELVEITEQGRVEALKDKSLQQTEQNDEEAEVTVKVDTTTLDPTGLTLNKEENFGICFSQLIVNLVVTLACAAIFSFLRKTFPMIYSNNVLTGIAPFKPTEGLFSWFRASLVFTTEEAIESIGMDNAMLIEFINVCTRIAMMVGIPMFFIMGPINCLFGGYPAGHDYLSYFSFDNVEIGSWLYDVHALVVWMVVLIVQTQLYKAKEAFLPLRYDWLRGMADVRANTIMVDGIPDEIQSDAGVKGFFDELFPGKVKSVWLAKDLNVLEAHIDELEASKRGLYEAETQFKQDPSHRPTIRPHWFSAKVDAIDHHSQEIKRLEPLVSAERNRVNREKSEVMGVNCDKGFVTFYKREDAEIALRLDYCEDAEEMVVRTPPEPSDLLWADLKQDPQMQSIRTVLGYGLLVGLFFAYMPSVIFITQIAVLIHMGPLDPVWAALAPTMGLQFMVAFLPTFLLIVFRIFFTMFADAWAQHKLQFYYFWFQIAFVVFSPSIGTNVVGFMNTLFTQPFELPIVLAQTMPSATHFYIMFVILQWSTHAMCLLRYVPLSKFQLISKLYEPEAARELSEPEDQDYYGLGSRNARFTILLVVCIVYGHMAPPVMLMTIVCFPIMRVVYGYLVVYAETRKPDLGGVFYMTSLQHVFVGLFIYCIVMTGVFSVRGSTNFPMIVCAPTIGYVAWSMKRFETLYQWERLPFKELNSAKTKAKKKRTLDVEYVQKSLQQK